MPEKPRRRSTIARNIVITLIFCNLFFFIVIGAIVWVALNNVLPSASNQVWQFGYQVYNELLPWFPIIGLLSILLFLILWLIVSRQMAPISQLSHAVDAISRGKTLERADLGLALREGGSEFAELAANVTDLSQSLLRSTNELEEKNRVLMHTVKRLEGLHHVSEVMSSTFDIDQLLRRTASAIRQSFGYERVGVALYDNESLLFRFSSAPEDSAVFAPPTMASLLERLVSGRAALSGRSQQVNDLLLSTRTALLPGFPDARSELAVPAINNDKVLAVIVVQSGRPNAFSHEDENLLSSIAPSLGVALANSSLFRAEQLRRQLAESIYQVAQSFNSSMMPDNIPSLMLDQVAQLLPYDRSAVLMLRARNLEIAEQRGAVGGWRWREEDGVLEHDSELLIFQVLKDGRARLHSRDDYRTPGEPRSVLAVPFMRQGRPIGMTVVERDTPDSYGEEEQRALMALVSQASIALENVSLYAEAKERTDRLKVVSELIDDVSSPDRSEVLKTIVQKIRLFVPCDYASIAHYETSNARFRLDTLYDAKKVGDEALPENELYPADDTPWKSVFISGMPNYTRDLRYGIFPIERQLAENGLRSCVVVPIASRGESLGTINLASRRPSAFTEDQIRTLTELSRYLATAIINARETQDRERTVSELARAQERLTLTARLNAVGELASGVAHDFNNLLAGILGNAQILLFEVQDEEQRDMLRVIERAARGGSETVKRLQTFTRTDSDTAVSEVPLHLIVRDALDLTRPRWRDLAQKQGRPIEVKRDLMPVPSMIGRAGLLRDAITNLIINAVDAMPQGGSLIVRTYQEPEPSDDQPADGPVDVLVEISDTGIGMSPEVQEHIFDRFWSTKGDAGTGQGLTVVKEAVLMFGGTVTFSSQEGKGSTFVLRLPVRHIDERDLERGRFEQAAAQVDKPMTPAGILVVEDDEMVRDSLVRILQRWGHRVVATAGGMEALNAITPGRFDVVMTDLGMPDISGSEVLRRARQLDPGVRTVLLTGWGEDETHGADFVLPKPFDQGELRAVLLRALS